MAQGRGRYWVVKLNWPARLKNVGDRVIPSERYESIFSSHRLLKNAIFLMRAIENMDEAFEVYDSRERVVAHQKQD